MDIGDWLRGLGLAQYEPAFREHAIDADVLAELTEGDLQGLGIPLGHRKRLLRAIRALGAVAPAAEPTPPAAPPPAPEAPQLAERRQLTVLFCDLVGSTALSARLDPEDLREVVGAYHQAVSQVVRRHEGFVAKYLGDGVLAYFGYPRAHEDDAERAVRAGLTAIQAVGELQAAGEPLAARVGIATGLVVVGDLIGEGAAREQAVVGETPNLAARLQTLAEPGWAIIAASTRRLLGGLFEYRDLGAVVLKGFAEPVAAFQVLRPSATVSRFEARQERGAVPLVGREEELELLQRRWRQVKAGEGRVVLLTGEPGIGKSRIVQALQDRLEKEPHVRLRYFCLPHHQDSTLHPVVTQLERAAGFTDDDTPDSKLPKLEALLAQSNATAEEIGLIAGLLSIPTGERHQLPDMTPQRRKERTFGALLARLAGLTVQQTLLMVFEDAHWIDPTSLEFLSLCVGRLQRLPVLLLVTARPGFKPPWPNEAHVTALAPTRLGRADAAALVARVAGGKSLPTTVVEQILARTDGVPLFVEELTKTVLESGLLTDGSAPLPAQAIPSSLHDSLLARLDRLGPAREVAQIGAVIGREFTHDLLSAVAGHLDTMLEQSLAQLVRSELLFWSGAPPDARYSFKHVLVQHAAYESLLRSRRRELHGRIAKVLEERLAGGVEQPSDLLVHHATLAEDHSLAVRACVAAGERSLKIFANEEALRLADHGLAQLAHLPPGAEQVQGRIALLELKVFAALGPGGRSIPELMDQLQAAADDATEMGLHGDATSALVTMAAIEQRLNKAEQAGQAALRAERASRLADEATHCHQIANTARCLLEVEREVPRALALVRDAEALAETLGLRFAELEWARAHAARWRGDLDGAHALMSAACDLARRHEDRWRESGCLVWLAMIDLERQRFEAVLRHCDAVERIAARMGQGQAPVANALRALAHLMSSGQDDTSSLDRSLAGLREFDDKAQLAYVLNHGAALHLAHGRATQARAAATEAMATARAVRRPTEIAVAGAILARAFAAEGDRPAAMACFADLASACEPASLSARARAHVEAAAREIGAPVPELVPQPQGA